MALSDRDIIITPNRGAASEPNILYRGGDALNSGTITLTVLNTGSTAILRWSGSAGNLVSITNTSGTALNVLSTTQATSTLTGALQVAGGVGIQGNLWVGGTINGTIAGAGSATTATNLAGGAANRIPFQTAPNTTGFIVAPSVAGTVLTWNGSAFTYTTPAGTFNGGTITNPLFINNATPTSSTSTGAFVVLGGVGIGGNVNIGQTITTNRFIKSPYQVVAPKIADALGSAEVTAILSPTTSLVFIDKLAADPSGRFLYAVRSGQAIVQYSINQATGEITEIAGAPAASGAFDPEVDPTGRFLYVTLTGGTVAQFSINQSTGALTSITTAIAAGTFPLHITVDPTGRFAYVANRDSNNVSQYTINQTTGALTANGTFSVGSGPRGIFTDPTGRFVYIGNAANNTISAASIDQNTGALSAVGAAISTGFTGGILEVAVDPSGRFLYAANGNGNAVSQFLINQTTGALTANGSAAVTNPAGIVFDPTGHYAFVTTFNGNSIAYFDINQSTGILRSLGTVATGGGSAPSGIAIDPTGTFIYTANYGNNTIGKFAVNNLRAGNATISNNLKINGTTAATSTSSGALVVTGGVGIGSGLVVGGITTVTNTTNASSTITGALVVTGGAGVGGNLYVGGNLVVNGSPITPISSTFSEQTATAGQTTFTIPGGYTAPFIQVFANGILLSSANYTATNGTTVVVNNARNAGDIMRFVAGSSVLGFTTSTFSSNIFGGAANQLLVQTGLNATGFITAPVTSNTVLTWNGSAFVWNAASTGVATSINTVGAPTNAVFFPAFVDSNNATATAESLFTTSSFTINPSTRAVSVGGQFNSTGVTFLAAGLSGDVVFFGSSSARTIYNNSGSAPSFRTESAQPLSFYAGTFGIGGLTINNAGGVVTINTNSNASSTVTGALRVVGGAGIGGNLYVGGTIFQNGVPVGTGAASSAAGVTTVSSATNAARFITFVDNNHGSATTSSVYTDAGITYNPSTNALRTAGTGTFAVAVNTAFTPTLYLQNNAGGNLGNGTAMLMSAREAFKAGIAFEDTAGFGVGTLHLLNNITANGADATKADARLSIVSTGQVIIPTAISATSTSTGALVVRGGIGANGNIYTSGNLFLENANANITLGSSTLGAGLKTVTLNRTTTGDSAIIRAGNQSYFGGNTNLDILNNSGFTNFDLRSFSSAGWGPTGQGVRLRIEGTRGDVQIFNNTEAISTSTGALQVRGGLAVGGNIHFGGNLYQNGVLFTAGGGGEPIVFNDISANFDGLESVFTLKDGFNSTGTVDVFSAGLDWTAVTLPLNGGGGAPPPSTTLLGTTVGNGSIVVPANVTTMVLEAWGAGGGSAGLNRRGTDTAAGGAFATSVVNVTPGQTVFFSIGAGGTGGSTVGGAGTQSWINVGSNSVPVSNTTGVRAAGGAGSGVAFPNNSTQLANSVGTVINIGGAGPQPVDDGAGGGGDSGLYNFTTFTFSTANTRGHQAPALSTLRSFAPYAAQSEWTANNSFLTYFTNVTYNGYQIWTVPATGAYTIEAAGAAAWDDAGSLRGGRGYARRANFNLTEGELIIIAVGQPGLGSRGNNISDGGGGGGTFVVRYSGLPSGTPTTGNSVALLISGGGGHGSTVAGSITQADGNANQNATSSQTNQAGGTNGNGGPTGQSGQSCAGQGSGYFSDAGETPCGGLTSVGVARGFFTGLLGGAGTCQGNNRNTNGQGGFGGGGGNGCGGSGGGGGYSGGAGSWASGYGSGGGSFINTSLASAQVNLGATNNSYGYVTITKV
jgi:6-phosphogluconolactonase (cycloisomerase 2 family)